MGWTRKLLLATASLGAAALLVSLGADAKAARKGWKLPKHAVKVAPGIYKIGQQTMNGRVVEGFAIVDHAAARKAHAKGGQKGPPDKGNDGGDTGTSTCYSFLANGANWGVAEDYVVDPSVTHTDGTIGDVAAHLATAISEWETAANLNIFGVGSTATIGGTARAAIGSSANGTNEVVFDAIDESGVIAVTIVWGVFRGRPSARGLTEWDQIYDDDGNWSWGSAGSASSMDFLNIAVHEIGHAMGMGHTDSSSSCAEETMYPYAAEGETKKRDIHDGDIAGINALYN